MPSGAGLLLLLLGLAAVIGHPAGVDSAAANRNSVRTRPLPWGPAEYHALQKVISLIPLAGRDRFLTVAFSRPLAVRRPAGGPARGPTAVFQPPRSHGS